MYIHRNALFSFVLCIYYLLLLNLNFILLHFIFIKYKSYVSLYSLICFNIHTLYLVQINYPLHI